MEIWKDIPGYEGLYQVSNMGRVKSLERKVYRGKGLLTVKERVLKPRNDKGEYLSVRLYKDGNVKQYLIHRLVLMTFNPVENMNQLDVDHINTMRIDNRLENLRWTTRKENCNNSLSKIHYSEAKKGKTLSEEHRKKLSENNYMKGKLGVNHPKSIPIVQLTLDGKLVEVYGSTYEAGRYGFNPKSVNSCCKGNRKTHCGYKWLYLHEYVLLKYPKITEINLFGKSYNWKEVNN